MDGAPLGLDWLGPHFPGATISPLARGPRVAEIFWKDRKFILIAASDHYYIVDGRDLATGIAFSARGERLTPGYPPV
jgi:hypothetical protein